MVKPLGLCQCFEFFQGIHTLFSDLSNEPLVFPLFDQELYSLYTPTSISLLLRTHNEFQEVFPKHCKPWFINVILIFLSISYMVFHLLNSFSSPSDSRKMGLFFSVSMPYEEDIFVYLPMECQSS